MPMTEKQTEARPAAAAAAVVGSTTTSTAQLPPRQRASVPAFGGWEGGAAAPDYSMDFTKIRAARMQQRRKALSWSSFVGDAAAGAGEVDEEEKRQRGSSSSSSLSAAGSDGDGGDRERRRPDRHRLGHRRLRSHHDADDRQPIQPGRAAPKGRSNKLKGYVFGCVAGGGRLW